MHRSSATGDARAAERSRIASIFRAGRDMDRPRQALRLALSAPVGLEASTAVLATLPKDSDAPRDAKVLPDFGAFGTAAAQGERRRITSAFSRPEAAIRFSAAAALILEGNDFLIAEQIAPVLAVMPAETAPRRIPSIGERAADTAEFGPSATSIASKAELAADSWSRAVAAANTSLGPGAISPVAGLVDLGAPATGGPLDAMHPHFGLRRQAGPGWPCPTGRA